MKQIVFLIGITFFSLEGSNCAFACKNIHLDQKGGSMEKAVVYDQGQEGTCFANAAATVLDTWAASHPPHLGDKNYNHVSFPLDLAVRNSTIHRDQDLHTGGSAAHVLEDAKTHGTCDPTQSTSHQPPMSSELNNWLRNQYNELEKCKALAHPSEQKSEAALKCQIKSSLPPTIPDLKGIEKLLGEKTTLDGIKVALNHACPKEKREFTGGYSVVYHSLKNPKDLIMQVESQFNKPAPLQPMTVGFCANILTKDSYAGVDWSKGNRPTPLEKCETHEATIIGEEVDSKGHCKLIVQNSWGTSCNAYSKKWTCKNGKISIDAEILAKNALQTTYLKEETSQ